MNATETALQNHTSKTKHVESNTTFTMTNTQPYLLFEKPPSFDARPSKTMGYMFRGAKRPKIRHIDWYTCYAVRNAPKTRGTESELIAYLKHLHN